MRYTEMCVICMTKKAKTWSGHVLRKGKAVLAGYCNECDNNPKYEGFRGHYKKKMDLRKK